MGSVGISLRSVRPWGMPLDALGACGPTVPHRTHGHCAIRFCGISATSEYMIELYVHVTTGKTPRHCVEIDRICGELVGLVLLFMLSVIRLWRSLAII